MKRQQSVVLPYSEASDSPDTPLSSRQPSRWTRQKTILALIVTFVLLPLAILNTSQQRFLLSGRVQRLHSPAHVASVRARCASLSLEPESTPSAARTVSDRYVPGTKSLLIRNATVWTGRLDGEEVVHSGDVVVRNGVIQRVGRVGVLVDEDYEVVDANGAWVTPGIVDMHSHLAVDSAPELRGANDGNSRHGITQPWLRSLDGLNTHDDAYALSMSGGVTTALVLPGSANAIGGQGFVIKLRPTAERSPTSMLLDAPSNTTSWPERDWSAPPKWRQMKHACGENPSRVYQNTRMDNIWAFRAAYEHARQIKEKQDEFCARVQDDDEINALEDLTFPDDLQWEALVDVLRGRVKVHVHCYETVDLDDVVRLTNEFRFPIAAFHHAHETYLVPDLLKKAYGHPPASAIFATNARYKREAFRGSEFAARVLAQAGLKVVMKSDHPVLNSRYLLYEAQQAFFYGLPANLALQAVTSVPAETMGISHRVGTISEGMDADLVIWDSHPLALGATPKQVYIDGIPQITVASRHGSYGTSGVISSHDAEQAAGPPYTTEKPPAFQVEPRTPNWDREAAEAVQYEGLPPIAPTNSDSAKERIVVFGNVSSVTLRSQPETGRITQTFGKEFNDMGYVIVKGGRVLCADTWVGCGAYFHYPSIPEPGEHYDMLHSEWVDVDLKGGSVGKGLVTYGSPLGMEEIQGELSTSDGVVWDSVLQSAALPNIVSESVIRAADGLVFGTRHAYLAYRAGVITAISAPKHRGFLAGLGTAFSVAAPHRLADGAMVKEAVGLHVSVGHYGGGIPSVSTQIGVLRSLLLEANDTKHGEVREWFGHVAEGDATLVVNAESADVIASLLALKREVEGKRGTTVKMTVTGASEAHLLAKEIANASVGVVLVPSRPFPANWESRRILPGPPLTQDSAISVLLKHNVTVGIGIEEPWSAKNTRFDIAWAALEAEGGLSRTEALALASTNLERLLGLEDNVDGSDLKQQRYEMGDLVVTESGDLLDFHSKVVGVISPHRGQVDLF